MIEYSLDLDLPDVVFENPIIKAMSDATTDLMTWPNVCYSLIWPFDLEAHVFSWNRTFVLLMWGKRHWPLDHTDLFIPLQKEQADGDYQNLVFCIMHERDVGLQEAINILTEMLNQRVDDYINLKSQLPSFGADVDAELERYLHALENFTQGTVMWYYLSPSKCRASLSWQQAWHGLLYRVLPRRRCHQSRVPRCATLRERSILMCGALWHILFLFCK